MKRKVVFRGKKMGETVREEKRRGRCGGKCEERLFVFTSFRVLKQKMGKGNMR